MLILSIIAVIICYTFAFALCKSASEADKELSNFPEDNSDVK